MRVFLDTNVLVSAFAARGLSADLFELVLVEHDLVTGRAVLAELEKALREKDKLPPAHCAAIVNFVATEAVRISENAPPAECKADDDDRIVLGETLAGGAGVFVTGDADLLALGAVESLRIVTARKFWESIRGA